MYYTWSNDHDVDDFIQERLDRVLVNSYALGRFPNLEVSVPPNTGSVHNMSWLDLDDRCSNMK